MFRNLKRYSAKKSLPDFFQGDRSKVMKNTGNVGVILDLDLMEHDFDLETLRKEFGISPKAFYPIFIAKNKRIPEKYKLEQFDGNNLSWKATFKKGSNEEKFQKMDYALLLNYFIDFSAELMILSASVSA